MIRSTVPPLWQAGEGQTVGQGKEMEHFKVASVQMNALKDDLDHNLDTHVRFIAKEDAPADADKPRR